MQQDRAAVSESLPADEGVRIVEETGGALLVEQLRAAGVRYIFHTNTSGVAAVMDRLVDASDMHVVMVTHEGQAVAAAQGYALATGELAFFLGSDDGINNAASNLHYAFADTTPLIAAFENGGLAPLEPYSAWSWRCTDAQTMPAMLRRGIKFAVAPPEAPVSMVFPREFQERRIKAPIYTMDAPVKNRPVFRAPEDVIERMARWLVEARNPLFVVGREVSRGGAIKGVQALAEKLSVPVCQSHRRDNVLCDFPTDHPLFLGSYISPMRFPQDADLFMNFGATSGGHQRGPPAGATRWMACGRYTCPLMPGSWRTQSAARCLCWPTWPARLKIWPMRWTAC